MKDEALGGRLHDGLERLAATAPDSVAIVDRTRAVSYGQLNEASNRVAAALLERGVRLGDRVGLYVDKSLEAIVGIYGAMKAGAAYVPFDAQAPPSRLAYIAADCDIRCLLTGQEKSPSWRDLVDAGAPLEHLLILNGDVQTPAASVHVTGAAEIDAYPSTPPDVRPSEHDLAYILYTSGSTGVPKGVKLSHGNGLAFVRWAAREFGVSPSDRLSSHAPLQFDLSIFDIFAASHSGATVVLVPPETSYFPIEVARFIETAEISVWYSVPSILNMLVQRGKIEDHRFERLRTLLFAGEVFPVRYLRRLMELLPRVRFCNLYGPTETNVCTWYDVPPIEESQTEPVPIGRAIDDVEVFALTDTGDRARPGEIGELHVRGPTVMQGYWGDADRTEKSLVSDPFSGGATTDRVYRTGDLVIEGDDGNYRLLGRRDNQIKSRGYRIELGDIEAALYAHPAVVECAVLATPDEIITNRIMACIALSDDVSRTELMRFCSARLPRHMVPDTFRFLDVLPKTATGKIDRQALATPEEGRDREGGDA